MKPDNETYSIERANCIVYSMESSVVVVAPNREEGLRELSAEMGEDWVASVNQDRSQTDMYWIIAPDSNSSELIGGFTSLLNDFPLLFEKGDFHKHNIKWGEIWKSHIWEPASEFHW